ncbi:snRNA-activating protein complex subunit 4 [Operophtera brumata]|uniref:snRNA-activating protein complex subunit 4 n=1 Tax=Operophtera brumata TaxID=104452 RepID=A0A0L7LT06_OPEBR|nr:snRNA-activating protein complex subunit 4 [Operophtera brumata]
MASSQSLQLQNDAEKESRNKIGTVVEAYDAVIQANNVLEQKYRAEEAVLLKRLHEVQAELREYKQKREVKIEPEKQDFFRYYSVGKPYFKDKNLNHPPDNEDTKIMKQYHMYDFSNVMTVSGWTVGDKTRLLTVLLDLSKDIVRKKIQRELTKLERLIVKSKAETCKIASLKRELFYLKNRTLEDLDLETEQEFDWEEVAFKLNRRHSSREYKAIWDLFFHPKVNKSAWSHEEHQELQRLAAENKMQDWESIAKALNTGRTGYQCFVYFRTNVSHAACGRKWTQAEMNYLQRVIDLYKEENYIPWGKVAASIENRTKIQCYNKYMRMIEGRKGRFLMEEDAVILNFVNVYGTDFRKMSSFLVGRSAVQLRVRYNLLQKLHVSATWSVHDDKKLLQIMANQDSRTNFSTATKHFPGKDRQNIRSRAPARRAAPGARRTHLQPREGHRGSAP